MPPSPVQLRFARSADLIEIAQISREQIEQGLHWRYTPDRLRRTLQSPHKNLVVACAGPVLIGFGIMSYREESANLDLLAVKPTYRNRGVGERIVDWLVTVARTAGIGQIFVQVRKRNPGAIRFYERIGFAQIDEHVGYYEGRESAVILCLTLALQRFEMPSPSGSDPAD
ncbi:MAG: GNAT family N-acetyltransferase [Xanthomonadales bacterium]|nr:GNAT family N-acetyltransferase [Xanthomonadales bacterium]